MPKRHEFKIELGAKAKDKITGFEGIIVVRCQWLNGCNTYGIKPQKLKDEKTIDTTYFDEPQLIVINKKEVTGKRSTGGPCQSPTQPNR